MNETSPSSQPQQVLNERGNNRSLRPSSRAFRDFMASSWAASTATPTPRAEVAEYAAVRRRLISEQFIGEFLIVPAGPLKVRSNDTDYLFRPHSAFAHLTGLGTDHEPDAVLVLEPVHEATGDRQEQHKATLFFHPLASRESEQFYASSRSGEFWIGKRPTLDDLRSQLGLETRDLADFQDYLTQQFALAERNSHGVRLLRDSDPNIDTLVESLRQGQRNNSDADAAVQLAADNDLTEALSEMRLVKDAWEIRQIATAIAATAEGFEQIVAALPRAVQHKRGERVIEGAFGAKAREEGNGLGYDTIAAAGDNATTLHWTTNNGPVRSNDLVLVDAGVEADSLYTADITRTLPVNGTFSPIQRKIYQAVLDAADAAFAHVRPGVKFRDIHGAAMEVLAERLASWGLLPVSVEEVLSPEGQHHRRWMPHGTSHHLGLDVHDCAQARAEMYLDGLLTPGMVFTIEPGLYFKADDLSVPEEYRGIGVRIEDDILVTENGGKNLSSALPRTPEDVQHWMAKIWKRPQS